MAAEAGQDQATTMVNPGDFLASLGNELPQLLALGIEHSQTSDKSFDSRREQILAQIRLLDPDVFEQHIKERQAKTEQQQPGGLTENDFLILFALKEVLLDYQPQSADDPLNAFKPVLGQFLLTNLETYPVVRQLQDSCNLVRRRISDPNFGAAPFKENPFANTILQFAVQNATKKQ